MEEISERRDVVTETYHGKPCKRGGHTLRYVSSGNCVACLHIRQKAIGRKYYDENIEKMKAYYKKYNVENAEKVKAQKKIYQKENPNIYVHNAALRRAKELQQTPPWADLEKIREIYMTCPKGYDVDHIHPLSKGGLHVDYNLQHLPMSENRSKGAKIL